MRNLESHSEESEEVVVDEVILSKTKRKIINGIKQFLNY